MFVCTVKGYFLQYSIGRLNFFDKKTINVDMSNALKIFSDSIYFDNTSFVPELVKGAVYAITTRLQYDAFAPHIRVQFFNEPNNAGMIISDNGIGFSLNQLKDFFSLATAGLGLLNHPALLKNDLVKQLGVSVISCFLIAKKVIVISKKRHSSKATMWKGYLSGKYVVGEIEDATDVGTQIIVTYQDPVIEQNVVLSLLNKYAKYLEYPVSVELNAYSVQYINECFVWEKTCSTDQVLQYGKEVFNVDFENFFYLKDLHSEKNKGIVYIMPSASTDTYQKKSCIYTDRMFISDNCGHLYPDWACFTKIVLNDSRLILNNLRDNISENFYSKSLKEHIGRSIIEYLIHLSKSSPLVLQKILHTHMFYLKKLAVENAYFLANVYEYFLFQTNIGEIALKDIKSRYATIYYVSEMNGFRQIFPIAKSSDRLVINAGLPYDSNLLLAISIIDEKNTYIEVSSRFFGDFLEDVNSLDENFFSDRIGELQLYLNKFNCRLVLKKFLPKNIPAMYNPGSNMPFVLDTELFKSDNGELWNSISEIIYEHRNYDMSTLYLNFDTISVQKILKNKSAHDREVIETMLINAMLLGQYPLSFIELEAMSNNFNVLISLALGKK